MDKISFKQILNEENFNRLKREFLFKDSVYDSIRYNDSIENINIDLSINHINVYFELETIDEFEIDDFGKSYNEKKNTVDRDYTINFFDDHLYPQMINQLNFFKKSFENEIKTKAIYETSALQRFCSIKLTKLNTLIDLINKSTYLDPLFQKKIISEIELLYEYINDKSIENSDDIVSKIPFKLNKSQLCLLFEVMYRKNIIAGIHINELHRLIEKYFTYYNGTENLEIKKSKKTVDELIGAKSSKSAQLTIGSLEQIFSSKDFFIV